MNDDATSEADVPSEASARGAEHALFDALRQAADATRIPILLTDPSRDDNPIVYANDPFESLTGYSMEEVRGRNCRFLQGEGTDPEPVSKLREAIDDEEPVTVELRNYRKDGTPFWNRVTVAPIYDEEGNLVRYFGTQEDVTERKRHERKLEQYEELVEASPDIFWMFRPDFSETLLVNSAYEEIVGQPVAALEENPTAFLEATHPDDRPTVEDRMKRLSEGKKVEYEVRVNPEEGFDRRVWIRGDPVYHDDEIYAVAGFARDVTERKEHLQELRARSAAIEKSVDGMAILDRDGRYEYVNRAHAKMYGYETPGELLGRSWRDLYDEPELTRFHEEVFPTLSAEGSWRGGAVGTRKDGSTFPQELSLTLLDDGRLICVVQDVTERNTYERQLERLNETTAQFHGAETREDVAETVTEILAETLSIQSVAVYLLEFEEGRLAVASHSGKGGRSPAAFPTFGPGDEPWEVFLHGETRMYPDLADDDSVGGAVPFRSGAAVPIEDSGVILLGDDRPGAFEERTVELVETVANAARETLIRISRARLLDEREETIREQTAELDRVELVTEKIRHVLQAIVASDSRTEIERAVCEHLASTDEYAFVWFADVDTRVDRLVAESSAGDGRGFLEAVDRSMDGGSLPEVQTAHSREPTVVENIADELHTEPWRSEALARGFQSSMAVPIRTENVLHGVLGVYARTPDAFEGFTQEILAELGETIADAISGAEQRAALLEGERTEIELEIRDDRYPWLRIAREIDRSFVVESSFPDRDGTVAFVEFSAVGLEEGSSADVSTVLDEICELPVVVDASATAHDRTLRVELARPDVPAVIVETGGTVTELDVIPERVTVRMVFPSSSDVGAVVRRILDRYPDTNLRRRTPEGDEVADTSDPLEGLTDRQREVLETAYRTGFFEWPRKTNMEELAGMLDIATPTCSEHLRAGQRKLLSNAFSADERSVRDSIDDP